MSGFLSADDAAACRKAMGIRTSEDDERDGTLVPATQAEPTNFGPCECEIPYMDFDGTRASVECGEPGTVQIPVSDEEGDYIVVACDRHAAMWDERLR